MTANIREWRHFLKLRTSLAAHPQMKEVAGLLLKELKAKIPVVFDDIGGHEEFRKKIGLDKYTPYTKEQEKMFLKFINGSR